MKEATAIDRYFNETFTIINKLKQVGPDDDKSNLIYVEHVYVINITHNFTSGSTTRFTVKS